MTTTDNRIYHLERKDLSFAEVLFDFFIVFYKILVVVRQNKKNGEKNYNPKVLLPNFSAHIFRHTFASNLVSAGVDARTAMDLLGHSSIETTMNIYVHVTEEMRENFLEKHEHMYEVLDALESKKVTKMKRK